MARTTDDHLKTILAALSQRARERGGRLTKMRLVKFLYLLDILWFAENGKTLTNWKWRFVHYGPYCRASTDLIDSAEKQGFLAAATYESKYHDEDYRLYEPGPRLHAYDDLSQIPGLPLYVKTRLYSYVDRYFDDTSGLLDYVYFHTSPMSNALPGDQLDFTGVQKIDPKQIKPLVHKPLSKRKRQKAKDALKRLHASQHPSNDNAVYDEHYVNFINALDEIETPEFSGVATVKFKNDDD